MRKHLSAGAAMALVLAIPGRAAETTVEHAEELEEVVVTASPIGDPDYLVGIAGSVSREQLQRGGTTTLGDALATLPGVVSSGVAAGAGRPVIRGMDANRVRTLEDGIGSFDVSDVGPDHGVPLEPLSAERVEVVRGAATLRYGSQAIGGVVNAISSRVPIHLPPDAQRAAVLAGFGTVADSRDFAGQVNLRRGAMGLHADAYSRDSGDYDTPEGTTANSWLRGEGGAVGAAWIGSAHRAGIGVVRNESRYGIPAEDAFIDMAQWKLVTRSSWTLHAGPFRQLNVDAGAADYEHHEREGPETHATFTDEAWDARAEALSGAFAFLTEAALGVHVQRRDFAALGEGAGYLAPTRTDSHAAFAFAESALGDQLRLQLGARLERVEIRGTSADDVPARRHFTPASVSAGLVFESASPWRLGISLSTAARAPAQTELFARGAHEATGTWEIGDAGLGIERARSAELSLRWRGARLHADGSLWVTRFSNYIHGELTGRSCSEEGACTDGSAEDLAELLYTQRSAHFHGAEGHAEFELLRHAAGDLHLEFTADLVRARFAGGAGNVPRIPPWRIGGGLSWQGARMDASLFLRYSGRQDRVGIAETPTAAFAGLDAQFAWRPFKHLPGLELALAGRNLTDSRQRNAVAINKDEVMLPGRDLRLVLRATLD